MLKKLKDFLGIEGVKLSIILDDPHDISEKNVYGKIICSSLSYQEIEYFELKLIEKYQRGRNENKLIDEYELGRTILHESFSLEKNEEKKIKFQLPFQEQMSEMDTIAKSGFFKRGIISIAKKLKGVKSNYRIEVKAKVKGSTIMAFAKKPVIFE